MTPEWRYHPRPLVFRKGDRLRTYRPEDKWQEKAIRGVMRRHGWRLVPDPSIASESREASPRVDGECP
jgi:hypothetical protein